MILHILRYVVSLGLILMIVLRSDLDAFKSAFTKVNALFFGAALLVTAFNMLVRSYKWKTLLRVQGTNLPLGTIQYVNYVAMFFNNFFLGSIGGDAFRVFRINGYSDSRTGATSSVIMDRATGFFMLLILVLGMGIWFAFMSKTLVTIEQLVFIALIGLVAGVLFVIIFQLPSKMINLKILNKSPKLRKFTEELVASIQLYKSRRRTVALSLFLSWIYHIGNSITVCYFARAANIEVSLIPLIFITSLVAILVMIPVSVNGLGIQEASYVFYLEQIGVGGPAALLIAILSRISLLVFSLIGGLLYLVYDSKYKQVTTGTK